MAWPKKKKVQPLRTQAWLLDELRKPKVTAESVGLTYAECCSFGWTSQNKLHEAIRNAFPDLGKGGVTQRLNKVWPKVYPVAQPSNHDRIEGSLWVVKKWNSKAAYPELNMPPRPSDWSHWTKPLENMNTLGYLQAATAEEAKQLAQVVMGPLAMFNELSVERVGPEGWNAAAKNAEVAKDLQKRVELKRQHIAMMQWEIEQIETLAQFIT